MQTGRRPSSNAVRDSDGGTASTGAFTIAGARSYELQTKDRVKRPQSRGMAGSTKPPVRSAKGTHIDGDAISEPVAVGVVMLEEAREISRLCLRTRLANELNYWPRHPCQSALVTIPQVLQDMVPGEEDMLSGSRGSLRSYAMAPCSLVTRVANMVLVLWATRLVYRA